MFCQDCDKWKTCIKVCKPLSKFLQDNKIYSSDYIRPRVSSNDRDNGAWLEIPESVFKGKNLERLR